MKINSKKKLKSWISTARLETIPLSISGIIIGSFYSFFLQKFDILIFILALLTAISYQILSNFANDYGDGILGTDDNRIGPKRSIASGEISTSELKKAISINLILKLSFTKKRKTNGYIKDNQILYGTIETQNLQDLLPLITNLKKHKDLKSKLLIEMIKMKIYGL